MDKSYWLVGGGGPCDYCVSPSQRIGFWVFSNLIRTWDCDLDLGLKKRYLNKQTVAERYAFFYHFFLDMDGKYFF